MNKDKCLNTRPTVCFDMVWKKRTIEKCYESKSVHGLMIEDSQKKSLISSIRNDENVSGHKIWHTS